MAQSHFIVCEHTNQWAIAFRRQLRATVRVYELRSLDQCDIELAAAPRSLVAVEVADRTLTQRLRWLVRTRSLWPDARMIVLARRDLEPLDGLFREAGAVYVQYSRRNMAPVARLVQRFMGPQASETSTLQQKIWSELPLASCRDSSGIDTIA